MSLGAWNPEELRRRINAYPPYAGALIEVTEIAADGGSIRVRMPLEKRNENLVGTQFGGSLYAMVDPHLMILLKHRLGPEYVVWDRAATIEFLRPGRATVYATITITEVEIAAIRVATEGGEKTLPQWTIDIVDAEGELVASVVKTVYVRLNRSG
jgi:acyl-coenzyme A thioesterase PaaI-like protein